MKSTATANYSWIPSVVYTPNAVNPFMRKGEVGGWKSYFTAEMKNETRPSTRRVPACSYYAIGRYPTG